MEISSYDGVANESSEQNFAHAVEPTPSPGNHSKALTNETADNGQLVGIEYSPDLAFEKPKVEPVKATELYGPPSNERVNQDFISESNKMIEGLYNSAVELDYRMCKSTQLKTKLINVIQSMGIILSLFAIFNIIAVLVAVLIITVNNLPLAKNMLWLTIELVFTAAFFSISFIGSYAGEFSFWSLSRYFKAAIVYAVLVFSLMAFLLLRQHLLASFTCAPLFDSSDSSAVYCVILICIFFSCLCKLVVTIVNAVLCGLLKRILIKIEDLELLMQGKESSRKA